MGTGAGLLLAGMDASGAELLPWQKTPGAPFSNYGQPSPHEKETIRWVSANGGAPGNGISWTPLHKLEGMITPNGLHFERHHNGVPQIDPDRHQLHLHGLFRSKAQAKKALLGLADEYRLCLQRCGLEKPAPR